MQVQTHGNTAYQSGLIDEMQKSHVDKLAKEVVTLIENANWDAASSARTVLIDWITNATGFAYTIISIYYYKSLDIALSKLSMNLAIHKTKCLILLFVGWDRLFSIISYLRIVKEVLIIDTTSEWVPCTLKV